MRRWQRDIRIGVIAGLAAGATVLAAPRLEQGAARLLERGTPSGTRAPMLSDAVQAASTALARGDSTYVAIAIDDSVHVPGVRADDVQPVVRLFSPRSTGLRGAQWDALVPRVVPYAAAYNAVVRVARRGGGARS